MELDKERNTKCPFICGICGDQHAQFLDYYHHVMSHDKTLTTDIHVCNLKTKILNKVVICRSCDKTFTCFCFLHDHIQNEAMATSYFFSGETNAAYHIKNRDTKLVIDPEVGGKENMKFDLQSSFISLFAQMDELLRQAECLPVCKALEDDQTDLLKEDDMYKDKSDKDKLENDNVSDNVPENGSMKPHSKNALIQQSREGQRSSKRQVKGSSALKHCLRNRILSKRIKSAVNSFDKVEVVVKTETVSDDDRIQCEENQYHKSKKIQLFGKSDISLTESAAKAETNSIKRTGNSKTSKTLLKESEVNNITEATPEVQKKRGPNHLNLVKCTICGKTLKKCKMKVHAISHSNDRPFKCDKCSKTYKYREHLVLHLKSHDQVLPFYCEVCGQGFIDANRLKRHVMMHADKRPFECEVCGTGFVTRYKLQRHMQMHTGVKKMQCDLCGVQLASKETLVQHVALVHKQERRFSCNQCDKTFFTNYQLTCHTMKHAALEHRLCRYREKIAAVKEYLNKGTYRPQTSANIKRTIRNLAKTHVLEGKIMKYVGDRKRGARQVVTDVGDVQHILKLYHSSPTGCRGRNSTLDKISRSYWWNGMKTDVLEYVSTCARCQNMTTQSSMIPSIDMSEPLELVKIELSGIRPYKCSQCKSDFVEKKELRRHMKRIHNLSMDADHSIPSQGHTAVVGPALNSDRDVASETGNVESQKLAAVITPSTTKNTQGGSLPQHFKESDSTKLSAHEITPFYGQDFGMINQDVANTSPDPLTTASRNSMPLDPMTSTSIPANFTNVHLVTAPITGRPKTLRTLLRADTSNRETSLFSMPNDDTNDKFLPSSSMSSQERNNTLSYPSMCDTMPYSTVPNSNSAKSSSYFSIRDDPSLPQTLSNQSVMFDHQDSDNGGVIFQNVASDAEQSEYAVLNSLTQRKFTVL